MRTNRNALAIVVLLAGMLAGPLVAATSDARIASGATAGPTPGGPGSGAPTENAGLYALWYGEKSYADQVLGLPYVVGGQFVVQWGQVETAKGVYDFDRLDREIAKVAGKGLRFTVQFNGNQKPAWLFSEVPYHPKPLSRQVRDEQGSLMWWHPTFVNAYEDFLRAMAGYLARSPHREMILGIRMNFNAYGTEHVHTPAEAIDLGQWIIPPGCDPDVTVVAWNPAVTEAYVSGIMRHFVEVFSPHLRVFVRNTIPEKLEAEFRPAFESGRLAWFHTSSEAEPRGGFGEAKYSRFYDDSRSGKTVAFAEPWASAWGFHGIRDERWCSPPQWNYWRLLIDLHCGVSFIGVYADDLRVAVDGIYEVNQQGGAFRHGPDKAYREEFDAAFRFARKYVGHHANPSGSPGAWVAFRESSETRAINNMTKQNRQLKRFDGDYDFLMKRLDDASRGQDVVNVGPESQRYGAFARILPAGESMRLVLDETFARSLQGRPCAINVIYYDRQGDSLAIAGGGSAVTVSFEGEDRWKTVTLPIESANFNVQDGAHLTLKALGRDVVLHMVEVQRVPRP